jgi:hypothetical protein
VDVERGSTLRRRVRRACLEPARLGAPSSLTDPESTRDG